MLLKFRFCTVITTKKLKFSSFIAIVDAYRKKTPLPVVWEDLQLFYLFSLPKYMLSLAIA